MERPDWDTYFLNIAFEVAQRATCPRASVGAVIVKDHRIISTGYNGASAGVPHCTEIGCNVYDGHCQQATHAEINAIGQAARFGLPVEGATMYFWDSLSRPSSCYNCEQVMKAAGILNVIFSDTNKLLHERSLYSPIR